MKRIIEYKRGAPHKAFEKIISMATLKDLKSFQAMPIAKIENGCIKFWGILNKVGYKYVTVQTYGPAKLKWREKL